MDTLFAKVAGLDVHLKVIQVAVRCGQESGKLVHEVRSFGTMTRDLRALADYLQRLEVTHVAMEATDTAVLAPRRGKNRTLVAVGYSLLVIIYHVLKYNMEYRDLRLDCFDRLEPQRLKRYLVKRLQNLGYEVTLSPMNPEDSAA